MSDTVFLDSCSARFPFANFRLAAGKFSFGRSTKCDLVVNDKSISRRHAEIAVVDSEVTVVDLGSRNGTYLDDAPIVRSHVLDGQRLRFGSITFRLRKRKQDTDDPNSEEDTEYCGVAEPAASQVGSAAELSQAEQKVLALLYKALSEKQIAAKLGTSRHTVHNQVKAIYRALKVHSRAEMLVRYPRADEVSAQPP